MATVDMDDRGVVVACTSCGKKNRLAYEHLGYPLSAMRNQRDLF